MALTTNETAANTKGGNQYGSRNHSRINDGDIEIYKNKESNIKVACKKQRQKRINDFVIFETNNFFFILYL